MCKEAIKALHKKYLQKKDWNRVVHHCSECGNEMIKIEDGFVCVYPDCPNYDFPLFRSDEDLFQEDLTEV